MFCEARQWHVKRCVYEMAGKDCWELACKTDKQSPMSVPATNWELCNPPKDAGVAVPEIIVGTTGWKWGRLGHYCDCRSAVAKKTCRLLCKKCAEQVSVLMVVTMKCG